MTVTTMLNVPKAVGVPEIALSTRPKPGGRSDPAAAFQIQV